MDQDRLGHRLRMERERRKIALESVAEKTKISIGLLRDLERDHLSRWPGGIFRRAFVRSYAQAIGVDPDRTLEEFLALYPDPPQLTPFPNARGADVSATVAMARLAKREPAQAAPQAHPTMRLTLAEDRRPFTGGPLIQRFHRRLAAACWDVGTAAGLAAFVYFWLDRFWIPLAMIMVCYHAGSVLVLGNTPGVYFFAPANLTGRDEPSSSDTASDALGDLPMFDPRGA
jgi:transcriptional regulator with XRE-family HTH domain